MKKTLKVLAVVALLLIMLVALTGCGNKIVATKESEAQGGIKYEEKLEIKLKKDKVDTVKVTMKFEDKETAEKMKATLDGIMAMASMAGGDDVGMDIKQSGKKVVVKLDAEQYASMHGTELEEVSKDELKSQLEEEGYKVK